MHRIRSSICRLRRSATAVVLAFALALAATGGSRAVDPAYQGDMERLAEVMGSLYFLQPLCNDTEEDWRQHMAELIELDLPDPDRRERLAGSFNAGYENYSRLYRSCTLSAREAMTRLLTEAAATARDIHSRYAD
jgi:uncharacterized protein (TIGR02301 family)